MTWRSPFQTTKGGGVPFPALTPWANSPGQLSDTGSPMQTSPTPVLKSVIKQGMPPASMKTSSLGKASPMDAAPYTPLSAPRGVHSTAPESDSSGTFVGKLSFTPHISQHRQRFPNSARKRSPRLSPDEQTTNSAGSLTQPPQSSIYFAQSGKFRAGRIWDAEQQQSAAIHKLAGQPCFDKSTLSICWTFELCLVKS